MKKSLFMVAAALVALFTACNKTMPKPESIVVNPSPLTVVGGKVNAEIQGTFPEKKFIRKGVLKVTPVLKFNNGESEIVGSPVTYVGEKAKENGVRVNYKRGGTYVQYFECDFQPAMRKCELFLRFEGHKGKKVYDIPDLKIAEGMVCTSTLVEADESQLASVELPDAFQRVISEMQEADIQFVIQQANLRKEELGKQELKELTEAIKSAASDSKREVSGLEIAGYASPDGGMDLNTKLAEQREKNTEDYIKKELKKAKVEDTDIETATTAEDWDGFRKLMEESSIQDKRLILDVLSQFSDPEEREAQIKNLSAVYENIASDILPQLRRSRLILTVDIIGRSDAEIDSLFKADPAQLSLEEVLYAASLAQKDEDKVAIYTYAAEHFASDVRAWNNMGQVYYRAGNNEEALRCYAKALEIEPNNADVNFNAGIAAMANGDYSKAEEYLGNAGGTQGDLKAAFGTLYTMKGEYNKADKYFEAGAAATNNEAVQQIISQDYASARKTLNNIIAPDATTSYLKAVLGARTNDRDAVYENLKVAVEKDASLKQQAATDIEFALFAEDEAFLAIVK